MMPRTLRRKSPIGREVGGRVYLERITNLRRGVKNVNNTYLNLVMLYSSIPITGRLSHVGNRPPKPSETTKMKSRESLIS